MLRRLGSVVAAMGILVVVSTGCGTAPVVGVLLPTTGDAETYGAAIESGIRLAIHEATDNETLPLGFEVVFEDTGSEPAKAIELFHKMVDERGVKLVIGGATSAEARALLPVLEDTQVICISPSASAPGLTQESRLFYRIFPSDELEGHTAAQFLHDRLDQAQVVLYADDTDYVRGIEPEFRRRYEDDLQGKVVERVDISQEGWEAASKAVLAELKPEAVVVIAYAPEILEVLRHLDAERYEGKVLTTSAFFSDKVIREAGPLAEGVLFPLPPFDRTSEKEPVVSFVHHYMDTYQRAPDIFAAHGYDTMRLVMEVLRTAKPPETPEISKALHFSLTDVMGVTGPILFDDYGDVKHYPKMFIVKDQQVISYQRHLKTERARIARDLQELLTGGD